MKKGKKIGARVEFLDADLLGRHLRDGADSGAGAGHQFVVDGSSNRGSAEASGGRRNFCETEVQMQRLSGLPTPPDLALLRHRQSCRSRLRHKHHLSETIYSRWCCIDQLNRHLLWGVVLHR